jgi:hypothetical protein
MPKMSLPHRVVEIPPARRDTHNHLDLYWWKHSIYALLEVDVTAAREFIEEHKARTSEALSFTATWPSASDVPWMRTSRCRRTRKAVSSW